jgi:hypothetical protein
MRIAATSVPSASDQTSPICATPGVSTRPVREGGVGASVMMKSMRAGALVAPDGAISTTRKE